MSNRIMYYNEARRFIEDNGWKLFLDKLVKDKIIIFPDKIIIDIIDEPPVIIKRHGKIVYEEG